MVEDVLVQGTVVGVRGHRFEARPPRDPAADRVGAGHLRVGVLLEEPVRAFDEPLVLLDLVALGETEPLTLLPVRVVVDAVTEIADILVEGLEPALNTLQLTGEGLQRRGGPVGAGLDLVAVLGHRVESGVVVSPPQADLMSYPVSLTVSPYLRRSPARDSMFSGSPWGINERMPVADTTSSPSVTLWVCS